MAAVVERNQKEQMKSNHGTGGDTGCCGAAPLLGIFRLHPIFAILWLIIAAALIVTFVLWFIALVKYCKAYREYQERHGKPYQSPCESNKRTRILLQHLRRLGLLINKFVECIKPLFNAFGVCWYWIRSTHKRVTVMPNDGAKTRCDRQPTTKKGEYGK